jgi:alpha-beta hydrolase superfamily lysophospholipase
MFNILNRIKRHFAINQMADFFEKVERNPISRTPKDVHLHYQDISFKSLDKLNLKAWFIPSKNSNKVVIFNHFMLGNRAGAIPHKDWGNVGVNFLPIYKHLVDAGYSIFTYDLRNHGESDLYKGGKLGLTHIEYQDSVAALRYIKDKFPEMDLYLYSQCYGVVSTMRAMEKHPQEFNDIKAFINLQPLSADAFVNGVTKKFKLEHESNIQKFSDRLKKKTGYTVEECKASDVAKSVKVPTLLVQVHDDWRTTTEDIENVFENISTSDKKLLWIEKEEERLEGYNYFAKNPKEMIQWLNKY